MRVVIVGAGLAGLAAAVDLVDAGHSVEIYESRPFVGAKSAVGKMPMETTLRWGCMSSFTTTPISSN